MSTRNVVVIGNFDGVHRGHQAVLAQAQQCVRANAEDEVRCVVLTFDPHPAEVLGRGAKPKLTTLPRRIELLKKHGADDVVVQPFTTTFAAWPPERFVKELIVGRLRASATVVGTNFRFGHNRQGDFAALRAFGNEYDFDAVAAEVVGDADGPFSSTRVRGAVAAGEVARAADVLGRPHSLSGVVVQGDQRGRTIGFPTANLDGVAEMLPAHGVYAIRARVDEAAKDGVANIGMRPTVGGVSLRIEAHLFDFDADLYGKAMRVELVGRLRGEQKFAGIDELRAQIVRDAEAARALLANAPGL